MSAEHDRKFFDTFMLVLGILIAIAAGLYVLARVISARTQEQHVLADPAMRAAVEERIAPVAKLAIAGRDNSALAPAQPAQAAPAADLGGEEVYNMAMNNARSMNPEYFAQDAANAAQLRVATAAAEGARTPGLYDPARYASDNRKNAVAGVQAAGRKAFVWTLDVPEYIAQFTNEGLFDGILSNYPSLVAYNYYVKQ